MRARSIDPNNSMVNLSLGLAYVHYALKRQATNRQYLLLQGQAFLFRYAQTNSDGNELSEAERCYNVGRLFHLLGINSLSTQYYTRALALCKSRGGSRDLASLIAVNMVTSYLSVGNNGLAIAVLKSNLRL